MLVLLSSVGVRFVSVESVGDAFVRDGVVGVELRLLAWAVVRPFLRACYFFNLTFLDVTSAKCVNLFARLFAFIRLRLCTAGLATD